MDKIHFVMRSVTLAWLVLALASGCSNPGGTGGGPVDGDGDTGGAGSDGQVMLDDNGVGFPESGNALVVVEEKGEGALGSAAYLGHDDGTTAYPTEMIADAGDETLRLRLNADGDPYVLTMGGLYARTSYNDNGTVNVLLADPSTTSYELFSLELASSRTTLARNLQLIVLDDLFACGPRTLMLLASQAVGGAPDSDLSACLLEQESLIRFARAVCLIRDALQQRLEDVLEGCPQQADPGACVRRVLPWIEAQEKLIEIVSSFILRRVQSIDALEECPEDFLNFPPADELPDTDGDGVLAGSDVCKNTPPGEEVNGFGCAASELGAIDCRDLEDSHCCSGDLVCDIDCTVSDSDCDGCGADGECIDDCLTEDPDCVVDMGDGDGDGTAEGCEVTGCPMGEACIDGVCGPCGVDSDCPDGQLCVVDECMEGVDVGEGCEVTGCGEDEVCFNSECRPYGHPTQSVCPDGFTMNFGVDSPSLKPVVLDRISFSQQFQFAATCVYVRQDGASGEFGISMFYEPIGVGSSPDGRCGEAGDDIVIDGGYHSTIRTITAVDSTPGSVRIVDPEDVFGEFIGNAVSAGVGSECFQDGP